MQYDQNIFAAFRELAVTEAKKLKVGGTYYRNDSGPFVIREIQTDRAHKIWWQTQQSVDIGINEADDNDPAWIITDDGASFSLHDSNIGASYNPWLVFENETLARACKEILLITYDHDPLDYYCYDDYDDYEYED